MGELLIFLSVLIITIVVHEVAHGYAADLLGDPTARNEGRLTLNPIPHMDILGTFLVPGMLIVLGSGILFGWAKPVPYNPYNLRYGRYGEALVAVAGSGVNIGIAVLFGLLYRFGGFPETMLGVFLIIAHINLFLGFLNLLPIPPLDGSKIIAALMPVSWRMKLEERLRPLQMGSPLLSFGVVFLVLMLLLPTFAKGIHFVLSLITGA